MSRNEAIGFVVGVLLALLCILGLWAYTDARCRALDARASMVVEGACVLEDGTLVSPW